ncbi:AsmA family protein [Aureibacter tunicatorum]|uniref:Uncharacterized protein involved in outer membrane biogenesis n=1 Tax=Aureibacter tunicatorum TaxID=866807 RepID=A0AAE3XJK3_9BACT|nr:AsmA-like C-terminal region-containing protein [Aureibacter tunicatorum]MDR6237314.1 uncharacterized protein involved in outer membrane biogenesis [Aureibacter tunicatorum]BDD06305.1 hypothetical protein AUTU_37880 [Aureibacter tunicatorum]
MKKFFYAFGGLIVVIFLAIILIPILFRDRILSEIDKAINKNIDAKIVYSPDNIDISLIKHFPNLMVSIKELDVIGNGVFANDTLAHVGEFSTDINLLSALKKKIKVNGIFIDKSKFNVIVLPDGKANYDIAKSSEEEQKTETKTEESNEDLTIEIKEWQIQNTNIKYDDRQQKILTAVNGLNHNGSGDFTLSKFDLETKTEINKLSLYYEGTEYIKDKHVTADVDLLMDMANSTYTFTKNSIKINDFEFGFDGNLKMNDKDLITDITFSSKESSFKNILSLAPGIYTKEFKDLEASGKFKFDGFVKGTYNEKSLPAFGLNLDVDNAMFKYPELPTAINNINIDMHVDNQNGVIEDTRVDIKNVSLKMGKNPLEGKILVKNLRNYPLVADIKAKVDLHDLLNIFPIDSLEMKGIYDLELHADGYYDSINDQFPKVKGHMGLKDGYIKSAHFPLPIENINLSADVVNETGKMENTLISIPNLSMIMNKERFDASGKIYNLNDINWDIKAKGKIDIGAMTAIYPIDSTEMKGNVYANIASKGKMSDLDNEKYDRLKTSGQLTLSNFSYKNPSIPQGVMISKGELVFDPKKMELKKLDGKIQTSDFKVTGSINNYLAYALKDDQLYGNLDLNSKYFDLNQFISETEETSTGKTDQAPTQSESEELIIIPRNLNLAIMSSIGKLDYDNLSLEQLNGKVTVKNGIVNLNGLKFNMLGGHFGMNGVYNTQNTKEPSFEYKLKVDKISIKKTYKSFATVRNYAPVAEKMSGDCSWDFKMDGTMLPGMKPNLAKLNGDGILDIMNAAIKNSDLVKGVNKIINKSNSSSDILIDDTKIFAKIQNGKVFVKPFDVKIGQYSSMISGSNSLDGTLDYNVKVNIPTESVGKQINSLINNALGSNQNVIAEILQVDVQVTGKYDDLKYKIVGTKGIGNKSPKKSSSSSESKSENKSQKTEDDVKDALKKLKDLF